MTDTKVKGALAVVVVMWGKEGSKNYQEIKKGGGG